MFCSYTGLSFVDVKSLRYADFKDETNGRTWIEKPRQKTKVLSEIPLLPKTGELMAKYNNSPDKSDATLVFTVSTNQKQSTLSIFEWIEGWYNRKRRHSSLGYKTIEEYQIINSNFKHAA